MGQDKANLLLGDRTLLQSVANTLQPLFAEVIVSVRQTRHEIDLLQVCDDSLHTGPLAGLVAGLERINTPWLFALACDMPFITPAVIECLALKRADCQAVVPMVSGYPQPLAAFYAVSCLPLARDCLNGSGKHSLRELLERLQVCYVNEAELLNADPTLASFFDLDTPQDVTIAMNKLESK
jgi:molybdopterin-guanine dinucleotide biosynthesis protein A